MASNNSNDHRKHNNNTIRRSVVHNNSNNNRKHVLLHTRANRSKPKTSDKQMNVPNNYAKIYFIITIVLLIVTTILATQNMNYQKDIQDLKTLTQPQTKIYVITIEKIGYWDYDKMIDCASRGYDAFKRDCIRPYVDCKQNNYCTTLIKNQDQEFKDFRSGKLYGLDEQGLSIGELAWNVSNYSMNSSNPWIVLKIN